MPGKRAATNRAAFLHIGELIGATACGDDVSTGNRIRASSVWLEEGCASPVLRP